MRTLNNYLKYRSKRFKALRKLVEKETEELKDEAEDLYDVVEELVDQVTYYRLELHDLKKRSGYERVPY